MYAPRAWFGRASFGTEIDRELPTEVREACGQRGKDTREQATKRTHERRYESTHKAHTSARPTNQPRTHSHPPPLTHTLSARPSSATRMQLEELEERGWSDAAAITRAGPNGNGLWTQRQLPAHSESQTDNGGAATVPCAAINKAP
jgi:hypothetical protein